MALGKLVCVEGPDAGTSFAIPVRGGGIGRGDDNAVQLSDLAVSRAHCALELRDGALALVDAGSRNRTLVNGAPVTVHVLQPGDEISLGKTRLTYVPPDAVEAPPARPSRVTIEVGSGELLRAALAGPGTRAQRHLAALARLGEALRGAGDRAAVGRIACEVAVTALDADRAFLLARDGASGRMTPIGTAIAGDDPGGAQLAVGPDVIDKALGERKTLAVETDGAPGRVAVAAPLAVTDDDRPAAVLVVDRRPGHRGAAWDEVDLMAVSCLAQLAAAAFAGAEARTALVRENHDLRDKLGGGYEFIGHSTPARSVLEFVGKVGPSDATVLLGGESGSGKEMVARAIHRASRRADQAFVAVNCAALTETLLESELFGHEKGAFTGATDRKLGRFELADGGTLFLDEIGELNLNCQTKFLRVLEEQVFERVGGGKPIRVNVRVVAATNRDLAEMVRRGGFREDLYYRLSVIHTVVPPLRARPDDVPALADHFLRRLRHQVPRRITGFTHGALRALMSHPWPGNVRELRNAVEHAIVLGAGETIDVDDLPPHIAAAAPRTSAPHTPTPAAGVAPVPVAPVPAAPAAPRSLRELERDGIIAALQATNGNKAQAAQILEIDRSTLYKKIKDYEIET